MQNYSGYGKSNDSWDDSLSLLPGQTQNRFDQRRQPPNQRFPNPRFGAPGANTRFRGPRPTQAPRPGFPATPLMGIQTRSRLPALQGLNSKLMNLANQNSSADSVKAEKVDSNNLLKPGVAGVRGLRPRGPRPGYVQGNPPHPRFNRPALDERKPFSGHQNRFAHPKPDLARQQEEMSFRSGRGGHRSDSMGDERGEGEEKKGWYKIYVLIRSIEFFI